MNKKRFIGITLFLISGLISLFRARVTGAVVGEGSFDYYFLISIMSLVFGLVVLGSIAREERGPRQVKDLSSILTECETDGTDKLILDSSGVIGIMQEPLTREQRIPAVGEFMEKFDGEIYASPEVVKELGSYSRTPSRNVTAQSYWKDHVRRVNTRAKDFDRGTYAGDLQTAREYIQNTHKHKVWKALKPYFEGKPENSKAIEKKYWKDISTVRARARGLSGVRATKEECLKELNKRWRASSGDIRVLADALHFAYENLDRKNGKRIKILSRDNHINEAVFKLLRDKPALRGYLSYEDGNMAA